MMMRVREYERKILRKSLLVQPNRMRGLTKRLTTSELFSPREKFVVSFESSSALLKSFKKINSCEAAIKKCRSEVRDTHLLVC
jgi:hypothetical protein